MRPLTNTTPKPLLLAGGKPHYLADAPRFIGYLDDVLPRHPSLQPLADLLERRVKPAMRTLAAA